MEHMRKMSEGDKRQCKPYLKALTIPEGTKSTYILSLCHIL